MLFLFNKVYLKTDHLFRSDRDRITISPRLTPDVAVGTIRHIVDGVTAVAPTFHASSYQHLIATHFNGNDDDFFTFLCNYPAHKRLTVYCDVQSMVHIASKFWKTLLPRASAETFWFLLDSALSQMLETLTLHRSTESFLSDKQAYELKCEIEDILADRQSLENMWSTLVGYTCNRARREMLLRECGVELQLATTLLNPTWRYGAALREKVVKMAHKRYVHDLTTDLKSALLMNIDRLSELNAAYQFDPLYDDLYLFVAEHPAMAFLVDDMFTPEHLAYVMSTYDLSSLAALHVQTHAEIVSPEEDLSILLQPLTFERLIDLHVSNKYGPVVAYGNEYREKVNARVVNAVIASAQTTDRTLLKQLELV